MSNNYWRYIKELLKKKEGRRIEDGSGVSRPRDASNKRHFELSREQPKNMLSYENKFNRPFGSRGNDKLSLMGSEQKRNVAQLGFTTAPKISSLKNFNGNIKNKLSQWHI